MQKEYMSKKKKITFKNPFKGIVDGSILAREQVVRQFPFVLFLAFLGVLYIANRYHAEGLVMDINSTQKEIKELKSKKIAIESELMYISKQSVVAAMVEEGELGLVESMEPPIKITVKD